MIRMCLFLISLFGATSWASEVVDLGNLDVDGEVRGQMMELLEGMTEAQRLAEILSRKEFLEFEKEMLEGDLQ